MSNVFAVIGLLVVATPVVIGLSILVLMWRAWWLYPAWAWFIVPLGVPAVSFWHFTALIFLIGILTTHIETKKDDRPIQWAAYTIVFLWPILTWALLRWMR